MIESNTSHANRTADYNNFLFPFSVYLMDVLLGLFQSMAQISPEAGANEYFAV